MPAALPAVAIASVATGVLSAGVGAMGAISSSQSQQAMANYQAGVAQQNAAIATQNANYATEAGTAQAQEAQIAGAQKTASIRAGEAANGLDVNTGTPLDVQQGQNVLNTMNVLTIQNNAARQAYGYQTQAAGFQAQSGLDTAQASAAGTAGMFGVAGSILGGANSITNNMFKMNQYGVGTSATPAASQFSGGGP